MPRRLAYLFLSLISLICLLPSGAFAACTSPSSNEGEFFYNVDFHVMQYCDGTNWVGMAGGGASGGGSGVTDGDKGDVTVSGSGATWTVDSSSITYAKIQNVSAAGTILGRATTGAGVVEEITLGSGLTLTGTTLSATGASSGTAGYIQFSGGSGVFASSSTTAGQEFFWDETNHRLGIGLIVPTQAVDVSGKMTANSMIIKPLAGAAAPAGGSGLWTTDGTNVWRATGNVGIGTTAPATTLHVYQSTAATPAIIVDGAGNYPGLALNIAGATYARLQQESTGNLYVDAQDDIYLRPDAIGGGGSGNVIVSSGNVGIGTTSPEGTLEIKYAGNAAINTSNILKLNVSGGAANFGSIQLTDNATYSSWINFNNNRLSFSGPGAGESLVINSSGNVGIGTTDPKYPLHVHTATNQNFYVRGPIHMATGVSIQSINDAQSADTPMEIYAGSQPLYLQGSNIVADNSGNLTIAGTATKPGGGSWAATSDARLKDIDGRYEQGLDSVAKLNTVRFHYKKNNPRHEPSDKAFVGLVAQDVQKVFPEAVSEGKDGYLSLDTTPINFAVINAIKELKADNDNLRAEQKAMRAEMEALKAAR